MYDTIIIGSGPAGISAALYLKRAGKHILILSKGAGALEKAEKIENYYGLVAPISGKELHAIGENQALQLGIPIVKEEVLSVQKEKHFLVETQNSLYEAKTVILATGTERKKVHIQGVEKWEGKGVSYCAICDAFFFRGKTVVVVGNGNYAIHELKQLKPVVQKVVLCTNGEPLVENRDEALEDITIQTTPIKEIRGEQTVESLLLQDGTTLPAQGIFIALGSATTSDLARKLGLLMEQNKILVDPTTMQTNIPGLYACGDCTPRHHATLQSHPPRHASRLSYSNLASHFHCTTIQTNHCIVCIFC